MIFRNKLPAGLLLAAVVVLFSDGVEPWMRLLAAGLLVAVAVNILMRRYGLSMSGLLGGFRRDS